MVAMRRRNADSARVGAGRPTPMRQPILINAKTNTVNPTDLCQMKSLNLRGVSGQLTAIQPRAISNSTRPAISQCKVMTPLFHRSKYFSLSTFCLS